MEPCGFGTMWLRDHCWVESDGILEVMDFLKDIDSWNYVAKPNVQFESEARCENEVFLIGNEEELKQSKVKDDKSSEAEGIFYLE